MVYYLNHEQIQAKHDFLLWLADSARKVEEAVSTEPGIVHSFAQERLLHLVIETATDLGNLLIDGFMMRDPSSYEDIIDILATEQVLDEETATQMLAVVRERKTIVQSYIDIDRESVHPLLTKIPKLATDFATKCVNYVKTNQL